MTGHCCVVPDRGVALKDRIVLRSVLAVALVLSIAALAGCSSGGDDATSDTTAADAATVLFDKQVQSQLAAVGCYSGSVDGIMGAESDAALLSFQQASGLAVDGELGPATETALNSAVAANETVCGTTTDTTPVSTVAMGAPCTATAIVSAIGGDPGTQLASYVCAGDYAGAFIEAADSQGFILKDSNGTWVVVNSDVCNKDSTEIPLSVKQVGCTGNGN